MATDGHRLAIAERPLAGDFELKKGVILPRKGLHELRKLLSEAAEAAEEKPKGELGFAENSAVFRRPGVVLVMRLIEGLFPDYKQVIPKAGREGRQARAGAAASRPFAASRCSPRTSRTP